uniref:Uncharacterized protein n=1 Tax=Solanum tuberosum TaxID=4113 RepID=M1A8K7_SOLTU
MPLVSTILKAEGCLCSTQSANNSWTHTNEQPKTKLRHFTLLNDGAQAAISEPQSVKLSALSDQTKSHVL